MTGLQATPVKVGLLGFGLGGGFELSQTFDLGKAFGPVTYANKAYMCAHLSVCS